LKETNGAMFMLYESMAWACLFLSKGIPVPLHRSSVSSTLFLWLGDAAKANKLKIGRNEKD